MKLTAQSRVALVAEELSDRPDEGVLRTLERLARFLEPRFDLHVFHCRGSAPEGLRARKLRFTRLGITRGLWSSLREAAPELVIYAPSASLTINALWRARLIAMASRCPVVPLGFQRRELGRVSRWMAGMLAPGSVAVTSSSAARVLDGTGLEVLTLPMGVDLERFRPADGIERERLRAELGWPKGETVVLHVGHLRARRGLGMLARLGEVPGQRGVVVASVSERGEEHVAGELRARGVEVHHEFIADIERFYQAADVYVFPVRERSSAIDFPLSVLEALACGLPVLTTPYGALPEHFDGTGGLRFVAEDEDPGDALADLLRRDAEPRGLVQRMGWDQVFEDWIRKFEEALR